MKQDTNKNWHKYCLGCSPNYIASDYDIVNSWTRKCSKGTCSHKCRNCIYDQDSLNKNKQKCVACQDKYIIDADDNLTCILYVEDDNCYMSVEKTKDQEIYLCGICWWGYNWHKGLCLPSLKGH